MRSLAVDIGVPMPFALLDLLAGFLDPSVLVLVTRHGDFLQQREYRIEVWIISAHDAFRLAVSRRSSIHLLMSSG
jgi:hypothetical protein